MGRFIIRRVLSSIPLLFGVAILSFVFAQLLPGGPDALFGRGGRMTQAQLDQIQNLSKEAIGFSAQRGDTLNIVNSPFTVEEDPEANLPWWRQRQNIELAKQVGKWALIGLIGIYLWFGVVRPAIRKHLTPPPPAEPSLAGAGGAVGAGEEGAEGESADGTPGKSGELSAYERNLQYARQVARQDPKIVATVVKSWVGGGDDRG